MKVEYDVDKQEYYIKEKINNQTFYMAFQEEYGTDVVYYNVYMTLYNKRKHTDKNENAVLMTGKNPFKTVVTARKAFNLLEEEVVKENCRYGYTTCVYATWLDTKRKHAYHRILSKKGYEYTKHPEDNGLCIMKKFKSEGDII